MRDIKIGLVDGEVPRKNIPMRGNLGEVGKAAIFSSVILRPTATSESGEGGEEVVELQGIHEIDLEYAEAIENITLIRGKRQIVLQTGNMMPPFQALKVCSSDLIREWGLNPEQHKSYRKRPKWLNQLAIVKRMQETYPRDALRAGESALIRMRVTVEPDGSISDCHLQYATAVDHLDSLACKEMRNARFEPALDMNGEPMQSYYTTSIAYKID